ncbi:MAG: metG 1 [Proteobacteria bacterium]|nr:metG 1 [Pseudomonadota bacterium]
MKPTFYITTAISYPNGAPHIGHAYEAMATDVMARFMRLDGYDVRFLTGTDEHGIKMLQTARKEGITARELANRNSARFQEMASLLNLSNDDFIRTSEERHRIACQAIWKAMEANGDIYLNKYAGWYSVRDEAYYGEEEIVVSDDGIRLGPQGTPVEWVEEESYFFRLSAYQEKLLKLYEEQPDFIGPDERRNEVMSFVRSGLKDLSISRTKARLRPWLPVQPRREDVEVARQRRWTEGHGRRLRARSGTLLLPARGLLRPGRQLQP